MDAQIPRVGHILVPLDGSMLSEQEIPYAHTLLGSGGKLTLFRVIPISESIQDPMGGTLMTDREVVTRYRVIAGQEVVTAMSRWNGDARIQTEVAIEMGDPITEIQKAAHERGADMIVMASKGRGAFGRLTLGSVTDRIARTADVPVVVIRADDALSDFSLPLIRRLIVPVDGSELSLKAVPFAQSIARQINASIHLVTIVDFGKAAPPALAYGAAFSKEVYEEVMAEIQANARNVLDDIVGKVSASGIEATCEVLTGKPAEAIMDAAVRGDLIVMSSHGHGGFKRLLLGSVAEKLVRHSPVPIAIVPAHAGLEAKRLESATGSRSTPAAKARSATPTGFVSARW